MAKLQVRCEQRRVSFLVPSEWLGRLGQCAKCGHTFRLVAIDDDWSEVDTIPLAAESAARQVVNGTVREITRSTAHLDAVDACANCANPLPADAVICANCGYDVRVGRCWSTGLGESAPTDDGSALLAESPSARPVGGPNAYQPHRLEFLINTDYGVRRDSYDARTAKAKGLVLFKRRWVTHSQYKQLRKENSAYKSIRQLAVLCFLGAIWTAIWLITERPPLLLCGPGIGISAAWGIIWIAGVTFAGFRLWRFEKSGRTVLVSLLLLDLLWGLIASAVVRDLWLWPLNRVVGLLITGYSTTSRGRVNGILE